MWIFLGICTISHFLGICSFRIVAIRPASQSAYLRFQFLIYFERLYYCNCYKVKQLGTFLINFKTMCWLCAALTLIGCCSEKRKSYMGKTISFISQTSDLSTGGCEMLWQKSLTLMKESTSKALTGGEDKKRKKLTFYLQAKQLMPLDTIKYLPAAKRGSACRCSISFH